LNPIRTIQDDIRAVYAGDPAVRTLLEVLVCYPGLHAIWMHRIAHRLWIWRLRFIGRCISHCNRRLTNIEIHPGARIGKRLFIDHGAGVVIGETAEIGDDVIIYQGVVLGGVSREKGKRHPTIGNSVVVGAHAILLGPITVGERARIGANAVVIHSVPPNTTMVGVLARPVTGDGEQAARLEHARLPDVVGEALRRMSEEVDALKKRIEEMEAERKKGG
jgi:serine O-acetyltransferase